MADKMFCYQCEQTAGGIACTRAGVCGKSPETSALHDLLMHAIKGLALFAVEGRKLGIVDTEASVFTNEALFATLTNVDFDEDRFPPLINKAVEYRDRLRDKVKAAGGNIDYNEDAATFRPASDKAGMIAQGITRGFKADSDDKDIVSLKHTLLFGLRGVAAYADHAHILGKENDEIYKFVAEGLAATLNH
ncbi:MAG: hydroxylamine reductase, partial [Desulfomonilaceae bacterium]